MNAQGSPEDLSTLLYPILPTVVPKLYKSHVRKFS